MTLTALIVPSFNSANALADEFAEAAVTEGANQIEVAHDAACADRTKKAVKARGIGAGNFETGDAIAEALESAVNPKPVVANGDSS